MVRLAIVGIGGYAARLIDAIRAVSDAADCRLVAAADRHLKSLGGHADRLRHEGVALFEDAEEMLRAVAGNCDAVYIAGSIATHAPLVIAAAEAGLHVHLEKPPAATIDEVDAMIAALERHRRLCLVGFHQIHSPDAQQLKRRLADGRLGEVHLLVCRAGWPRTRAYYARNTWAGRLRDAGRWVLDGPATNALAHQITNVLYAGSTDARGYAEPVAVRGELYAARADGDPQNTSHDTAAIEIRLAGGATAYWLGSHCTGNRFGPIIEIVAERGRVVWKPPHFAEITYAGGQRETLPGDRPHVPMVRNFVEAVRCGEGSRLRCTLADARKFILALNGAHESSRHVHRIGSAHAHVVEAGAEAERTVVDGLDDLVSRAAAERRLLSDLDGAPNWAVSTDVVDLSGYAAFGQRFSVKAEHSTC